MTETVSQILFVLKRVKALEGDTPTKTGRIEAMERAADFFKVDRNTIADKWIRTLGIRTGRFDRLLWRLLRDGENELLDLLRERGGQADLLAIRQVERALATAKKIVENSGHGK